MPPLRPLLRLPKPLSPISRRQLSTTAPLPATPLYMLSALSHARETQHYAQRSGLGVTHHSPAIEAIKASEVDPFASPSPAAALLPRAPALLPDPPARATAAAAAVQSPAAPAPPLGAREAAARRRVASLIVGGDGSVLRPGGAARALLAAEKTALAQAVLARSAEGDRALSAGWKARLAVAREGDDEARHAAAEGAAPAVAQAEEQDVPLEKKQVKEGGRGYQTFTSEGMQIALLGVVVLLVGVNAYAFETLGAEREAREVLAARLGRIEGVLVAAAAVSSSSHSAATATAAAGAPVAGAGADAQVADTVRAVDVLSGPSFGERMVGWGRAAFWAH